MEFDYSAGIVRELLGAGPAVLRHIPNPGISIRQDRNFFGPA
jgi:hypothetical protein